jgi:hypothetical protein
VNLEWRPAIQTANVGDTVEIGLYAVSTLPQKISSLEVILAWDPTALELSGLGNSQVILNPDFTTDDGISWIKGTGWTIDVANSNHANAASATGNLSQAVNPLVPGETYVTHITVSKASGGVGEGVRLVLGTQPGTSHTTTGTYAEDIVADGAGFKVEVVGGGFTGYVDAVKADLPNRYAWLSSSFPDDHLKDGLNNPFPVYPVMPSNDGSAWYNALSRLGVPAGATPEGLLVVLFKFKTRKNGIATVSMPPTSGQTHTQVWDGVEPNHIITGTISGPAVVNTIVVPAVSTWGLLAMALMIAVMGGLVLRRGGRSSLGAFAESHDRIGTTTK